MVKLELKDNEHIEAALRKFKRKVGQSGVLSEVFYRRYYYKPSDRAKNRKHKPWKK